MFVSKIALPRRTFLRGVGAAVALPLLDAMFPAFTPLARAQARPRTRFGAIYIPNGAIMEQWIPEIVGPGFDIKPILQPIESLQGPTRARDQPDAIASRQPGRRSRGERGRVPHRRVAEANRGRRRPRQHQRRPGRGATDRTGHAVPLARSGDRGLHRLRRRVLTRLQLRVPRTPSSWSSPSTPLPMDINPRVVFERMFGQGGSPAERAARTRDDRSMLDSVAEEARKLQRGLDARDRRRVSDYLDNLREIERRIQRAEAQNRVDVDIEVPVGVPDSFEEHVGLMYDLLAVAYQADVTRVFTFMLSRELSQRTYPNIGVTEQHHSVSHHGNDAQKIAQNVKVNTYHMGLFAKFLEKLRSTPDGDGSLLDHSLIFYGGGMGNPNGHASDPLPVLAVGGGVGKGHRHIKLKPQTPVGNLWLAVANKYGSQINTFGDSNGRVEDLFS